MEHYDDENDSYGLNFPTASGKSHRLKNPTRPRTPIKSSSKTIKNSPAPPLDIFVSHSPTQKTRKNRPPAPQGPAPKEMKNAQRKVNPLIKELERGSTDALGQEIAKFSSRTKPGHYVKPPIYYGTVPVTVEYSSDDEDAVEEVNDDENGWLAKSVVSKVYPTYDETISLETTPVFLPREKPEPKTHSKPGWFAGKKTRKHQKHKIKKINTKSRRKSHRK